MIPSLENFEYKDIDNLMRDEDVVLETALQDLDYQNVLLQTANIVNPYAIPAYGNMNQGAPTLATNTYDPYAENSPPDLSTAKGTQQAITNVFAKYNQPSLTAPKLTSNARKTNYDRFYNHPMYNELGFHPFADNEAYYNENSSWWDDASRMMGQFSSLMSTGFVSAYRSLGDLFDDDPYFFGKDLDSAREFSEAMRIGNSSRGGVGGFFNNTLLQSAYTFGIIGSIALEELILSGLTAATFGATASLQAGSIAKNVKRIGDVADNITDVKQAIKAGDELVKVTKEKEVARGFWESFRTGNTFFTKMIAPELSQTLRTLNTAKNTGQNMSNLAKIAPFGGFYRDLRSLNFALSESKMEGGMVYDEVLAEGLKIYEGDDNLLTEQDILNAKDKAGKAAFYTTLSNAPIIYFSNQLVLGNAFGSFNRSLAKVFNDNASLATRRLRRVKSAFKDGKAQQDIFADIGEGFGSSWNRLKAAGVKGTFKGTAASALRYFSANFTEGAQEVAQEAVAHATKHYYESIMKDPATNWIKLRDASIGSAINSQFNAQGFETFMSGFLMGGVVQGPQKILFEKMPALGQRVFQPEKYEKYKKEKQEYMDTLVKAYNETWNNLGKNPDYFDLSPDKLNYVLQKMVSQDLSTAIEEYSILDIIDERDESKFFNMMTLAKSGGLDMFKDLLKEMKSLDEQELLEAFPVFKTDVKEGKTQERIDEYIGHINKFEDAYNNSKNKLLNPFNPQNFEKGTKEYMLEALNYRAYEHARFLALFTGNGIERANERMKGMFQELESDPIFEGMEASDLTVLTSVENITNEISRLEVETKLLEKNEDLTEEDKKLLEKKTKKLKNLGDIKAWFEKNKLSDGSFLPLGFVKMRKLFQNYVQDLTGKKDEFSNVYEVSQALRKIMDYQTLDRRKQLYNNTLAYLIKPEGITEIVRAQAELYQKQYNEAEKMMREHAEKAINTKEQSEFLKQLNDIGVEVDPEQLKTFTLTNDVSVLTKFSNSEGLIEDKETLEQINSMKDDYKKLQEKPLEERIQYGDTITDNELRDQVTRAINESQALRLIVDRFRGNVPYEDFINLPASSNLLNAYKIIKRYEWETTKDSPQKEINWQNDVNLLSTIINNKDAITNLVAIYGFTANSFLSLQDDPASIDPLTDGGLSNSEKTMMAQLQQRLAYEEQQRKEGEEPSKAQTELEAQYEAYLKKQQESKKDPKKVYIEKVGDFYILKTAGKPIHEIDKYKQFGVEPYTSEALAEAAKNRLIQLTKQSVKQFTQKGKTYKFGTRYTKTVNGKPVTYVLIDVDTNDSPFILAEAQYFSYAKLPEDYKGKGQAVRMKELKAQEEQPRKKPTGRLSKINRLEFINVSRNTDQKNEMPQSDFEKILSLLTVEQINALQLKITRKPSYGTQTEFQIGKNAANPNLRKVAPEFEIGLVIPAELVDFIKEQTGNTTFDFTQPFAFINNQSTKITDVNGNPVNPNNMTDEQLSKVIVGYKPEDRNQIVTRYVTQLLFAQKVRELMEGQDEGVFSFEGTMFGLEVPVTAPKYGKKLNPFNEIDGKKTFTFPPGQDGTEYYVITSAEKDIKGNLSYVLRVYDEQGNNVGARMMPNGELLAEQIEQYIKDSGVNYANASKSQSTVAFINMPNGAVRYITLKSSELNSNELNDLFVLIKDKVIDTKQNNVEQVAGKETKAKDEQYTQETNEQIAQTLFISSKQSKIYFEVGITSFGDVYLRVFMNQLGKDENQQDEVKRVKITEKYWKPSLKSIENITTSQFVDAMIKAFNDGIQKFNVEQAKKRKDPNAQNKDLLVDIPNVQKSNFKASFQRLIDVDNILPVLEKLSTNYESATSNLKLFLKADPETIQQNIDAEDTVRSASVSNKQDEQSNLGKEIEEKNDDELEVFDNEKLTAAFTSGFISPEEVIQEYNKLVRKHNANNNTTLPELSNTISDFNKLSVNQIKQLAGRSEIVVERNKVAKQLASTQKTEEGTIIQSDVPFVEVSGNVTYGQANKNKTTNEDALYVDTENGVYVLADGMGGESSPIDQPKKASVNTINILLGKTINTSFDQFVELAQNYDITQSKEFMDAYKAINPYPMTSYTTIVNIFVAVKNGKSYTEFRKSRTGSTGLKATKTGTNKYTIEKVGDTVYFVVDKNGNVRESNGLSDDTSTTGFMFSIKDGKAHVSQPKIDRFEVTLEEGETLVLSTDFIETEEAVQAFINTDLGKRINFNKFKKEHKDDDSTFISIGYEAVVEEAEGSVDPVIQTDQAIVDLYQDLLIDYEATKSLDKARGKTKKQIEDVKKYVDAQIDSLNKKMVDLATKAKKHSSEITKKVIGEQLQKNKAKKKVLNRLKRALSSVDIFPDGPSANKVVSNAVDARTNEPLEDFATWLKENLPDFVSIANIDELTDRMKKNGYTVGRFMTTLKEIAGGVSVGGVIFTGEGLSHRYHEAFHAVFRLLLTDEEQRRLRSLARKEVRAKLRKEGKSFEVALQEFASKTEEYTEMYKNNRQEFVDLYYEEYLADQFEIFKTSPRKAKIGSEAKSIFQRFIEFIKTIFARFRSSEMTRFFYDIDSGKFRSSETADNRFTNSAFKGVATSADALIPFETFKIDGVERDALLDVNTSALLVNQILGVIQKEYQATEDPSKTYSDLMDMAINKIRLLYSEDNPMYADALDPTSESFNPDFETALININDAFENYKDNIVEAVELRLSAINLSAKKIEDKFEEAQAELGLRNTDQFDMTAEFKGGFRSLPEFTRIYFGSVLMDGVQDMFGNTEYLIEEGEAATTEEGFDIRIISSGERIKVPVDAAAAYNGFLKAVKNTTDPKEVLRKLVIFSQSNKSTEAVVRKFFRDIGLDYDQIYSEYRDLQEAVRKGNIDTDATLNIDLNQITNPALFQTILKSFVNFKVDYLFFHKVTEKTGKYSVDKDYAYTASNRDDARFQVDMWGDTHNQRYTQLSTDPSFREKASKTLERLQRQLESPNEYMSFEQVKQFSKRISEELYNYIGIMLSPLYIEYSILASKNQKDNFELIEAYNDIDAEYVLSKNDIQEIKRIIDSYGSDNPQYLFADGDTGAKTRMRNMALGNAEFSEDVGASTFLNAEGKLVYAHQLPTYNLVRLFELNGKDVDKTIERLIDDMPEQSKEILRKNHLLNNDFFKHMMATGMVGVTRIAGLKESTTSDNIEHVGELSKVQDGTTYGSLKADDLIRVLINSYTTSINQTTRMGFKRGHTVKLTTGEEAVLVPTLIRILEASNTGDMAMLPVNKTVEINNKGETQITRDTKVAFLNNIIAEFNRIQRESRPETATKETKIGYNAKSVTNEATMTAEVRRVEVGDTDLYEGKDKEGRAYKLTQTGKLLNVTSQEEQRKRVKIISGERMFNAVKDGTTKILIMNPNAVKDHQSVGSDKFSTFELGKNSFNTVTRFIGSIMLDKVGKPDEYNLYITQFLPMLTEGQPSNKNQLEIAYGDVKYYTNSKSLADFLNGKARKDVYEIVKDVDIVTEQTDEISENIKVISGGQTGVDQLGLEVAKEIGLNTGGTAPIGFLTEGKQKDPSLAEKYGVKEITQEQQKKYAQGKTDPYTARTEMNVLNSDATVYFSTSEDSAGLAATKRYAEKHNKPFLNNPSAEQLKNFIVDNNIKVLNVAGNRASKLNDSEKAYFRKTLFDGLTQAQKQLSAKPKVQKEDVDFLSKFDNIVSRLEKAARDTSNEILDSIEGFQKILEKEGITLDEFLDFIGLRLEADFKNFEGILDAYNIKGKLSEEVKGNFATGKNSGKIGQTMAMLNLKTDVNFNLRQIYFNDYLNKTAITQILLGDGAISFKDAVDEIKRAKGLNAAIVNAEYFTIDRKKGITLKNARFDLLTISDRLFRSSTSNALKEATDAQLFMTVKAFRYLWFGIGQLTDSQAGLLDKIEKGEEIRPEDVFGALDIDGEYVSGYAKKSEMINSKKLLYFDGVYGTFLKMSGLVLTKQLTSRKSNGKFVSKANRIQLHNLRMRLETHEAQNPGSLGIAAFASASKMMKQNVQDINEMMSENAKLDPKDPNSMYSTNPEFFTKLRSKFFGLQVVNPSNKLEIIDPTQMKVLITAEMPDNIAEKTFVVVNGEKMSLKKIREAYHGSKSHKLLLTFTGKRNLIFSLEEAISELEISKKQKQITPQLFSFMKYAKSSLEASNSAGNILSYFDTTNEGREKYNLNSRITVDKFMQLFLAYFSKKVMSEKQNGTQITLVSDEGIRVFRKVYSVDENGMPDKHEIIRENEFYQNYNDNDIALSIDAIGNNLRKKPGDDENLSSLKELVKQSDGKGVIIVDRLRPSLMDYDKSDSNPENWKPLGEKYSEGLLPSMSSDIYYMYEKARTPENIQQHYDRWLIGKDVSNLLEEEKIAEESFDYIDGKGNVFLAGKTGIQLGYKKVKELFAQKYGYGIDKNGKFFDKKTYEEINSAVSKGFAVRIPSQDKHSSINIRFVDFLPIFYGSSGTFAREMIVDVSGADFDIDKLFTHLKSTFIQDGEIREYGVGTDEELYDQYVRYLNQEAKRKGTTYNEAYNKMIFRDEYNKEVFAPKRLLSDEEKADAKAAGISKKAMYAMQMLNMPITKAEYESYKKKFGNEPYEAAIDNRTLDYKTALLGNKYMTSPTKNGNVIAFEPADLQPLFDVFDKLGKLLPEWKKTKDEPNMDSNTMYAQFLAFKNNKEGAKNIGAVVRPNVFLSLLGQLGISLNPNSDTIIEVDGSTFNKFGEPLEKYTEEALKQLKKDPQFKQRRSQYIISALITAMTDNAKERMASKLGLNKNALAVAANMISLGMPLKTAMLFSINPLIEYAYYQHPDSPTAFLDLMVEKIQMYNAAYKEFTSSDTDLQSINLTTDMMVDVIGQNVFNFADTKEDIIARLQADDTGEYINLLRAQRQIVKEYQKGLKINQFTKSISNLTTLTKSLGTSLEEIDDLQNNAKKLYLNQLPEEFARIYNTAQSPIIVDVREVFMPTKKENELFISTYYKVFRQIYDELLPKVALQRTTYFNNIFETVLENANKFIRSAESNNMSYDLLSYLTIKAYKKYLFDNGMYDPLISLSNDLLYTNGPNSIVSIINMLRNYEVKGKKIFATNYFLNNFVVLQDRNSIGNSTGANEVKTNQFTRLTPLAKINLQNSFQELRFFPDSTVRDMATALVHYMMVSDGLKMRQNGLTSVLLPSVFVEYLDQVQNVMNAFTSNQLNPNTLQKLFGFDSIDELMTEFLDGYFSSTHAIVKKVVQSSSIPLPKFRTIEGSDVMFNTYQRNAREDQMMAAIKKIEEKNVKEKLIFFDLVTQPQADLQTHRRIISFDMGFDLARDKNEPTKVLFTSPTDIGILGIRSAIIKNFENLKQKLQLQKDKDGNYPALKDTDYNIVFNTQSITTDLLNSLKAIDATEYKLINDIFETEFGYNLEMMKETSFRNKSKPAVVNMLNNNQSELILNPYRHNIDNIEQVAKTSSKPINFPEEDALSKNLKNNSFLGFETETIQKGKEKVLEMKLKKFFVHKGTLYRLVEDSVRSFRPESINKIDTENKFMTGWFARYESVPIMGSINQVNGFMFDGRYPTNDTLKEHVAEKNADQKNFGMFSDDMITQFLEGQSQKRDSYFEKDEGTEDNNGTSGVDSAQNNMNDQFLDAGPPMTGPVSTPQQDQTAAIVDELNNYLKDFKFEDVRTAFENLFGKDEMLDFENLDTLLGSIEDNYPEFSEEDLEKIKECLNI